MSSRALSKWFSGPVPRGQAIDSARLCKTKAGVAARVSIKAYVLGEHWRLARASSMIGGVPIKRLLPGFLDRVYEIARATREGGL
jgi:hypothetical protein